MIPRDTRTALQPVRYGGIPDRTATFRRHNTTLLIGVKSSNVRFAQVKMSAFGWERSNGGESRRLALSRTLGHVSSTNLSSIVHTASLQGGRGLPVSDIPSSS